MYLERSSSIEMTRNSRVGDHIGKGEHFPNNPTLAENYTPGGKVATPGLRIILQKLHLFKTVQLGRRKLQLWS